MNHVRFACGAAAVLSFVLASGCSLKTSTTGDLGKADFDISSSMCALGCGLDRPVLQGSAVTVQARPKSGAQAGYAIRVADPTLGTTSNGSESCTCDMSSSTSNSASASSMSADCNATCPAGFTKNATVSADVQTTTAGDVKVELVDATGTLIDSATFHVKPGTSIEATVNDTPKGGAQTTASAGGDGAFTVKVGDAVDVNFTVKDDSGNPMIFSKHGVIPTYSDKTILGPDPNLVVGSTDVENAVANKAGDATIKFDATGASKTLSFHVQ